MNTTSSLLRESSEKFFRDIYQGQLKGHMYTISKKLEIFTEYLFKSCQTMTEYMKERLCQRENETKTTQSVLNRCHNRGLDIVASQPPLSISCFYTLKKDQNKYESERDIRQTFIGIFCQGLLKGTENAK